MSYPQYRKYKDVDTWFKLESDSRFIEIKKLGSNYLLTEVEAVQFPEKLFIQDAIACKDNRWEEVESFIFESLFAKASK